MNSDLMNIIETQANDDDLLSPRPRSLEDKKGNNNNGGTPHYNFGLSLGRSQSAAPQWNFSNNPTSTKSAVADSSIGGTNNSERDIFGSGSRFFSEGAGTNEEGGGDQDDIIRRPASTGVIGRPTNEAEDGDVNSILETLGLASLGTSTAANNGQPSPYSTKSLGMGSHTPKKSLMEKINEGNNNQTQEVGVGNSNNYGAGSSSYFTNDKDPGSKALFQGKHEINQTAPTQIQYVQAPPQAAQVQQRQEQHSHYNPQQQIYYQQAPYQTQDYRGQQVYVVPQQQNVYHVNQAPQAQYGGYDQQYPQQQQHIIMHQPQIAANGAPMHGQPQYISVAAPPPHIIQGAQGQQQYAYIQYAQPAYVMGPNGPIPVSNPPMMNYSGHHGSSPPGGTGRSPPRSSMRTPDRQRGRNNTPTSRGKQRDRSGSTPSKLGPEAANLLEQIRAAKSRNQWTIHDIQGHVVEFCLDQNGSRFIQQRLEVAEADEKDSVIDEIIPAIKDLNNDVFGNYVVQKCYEFGTEKMKNDLKGTLKGNMMLLSLQMYGCRVVQKALESLKFDDICDLLSEFDSYVLTCIQDQNGNHVMQKCIEVMSRKAKDAEARSGEAVSDSMAEKIQFIVDDVHANVRSLCCHPYGCRVLQRMLEHCVDFQKGSTLDQIQLVHKALMDDQYGNYVIQHVLQYGRESDRDSLLNIIVEGNLLKLSRQKFASNVVEKLLKYGNSKHRNAIVREMLVVANEGGQEDGEGSTVLLLMVRDAYANYVVQTALDVVPEGHEKRLLLDELRSNEAQLRNYTFAKHIVAKITK